MTAAPSAGSSAPSFGLVDAGLYAACVIIFGTGWLPLRMQLGVVPPEVTGFWRFTAAALLLFVLMHLTRQRLAFRAREHASFAFLGATLFSLNFLAFYYAGYILPSGLMSVLFSLAAVFIPLLAAVFFGVALNLQVLGGAALGVTGTALVFGPHVTDASLGGGVLGGVLMCLAGTVLFAFGSIRSGALSQRGVPVWSMVTWSVFYGGMICLVIALVRGGPFVVDWSVRYLGSMLWLILGPTLLGFFTYLTLVRRVGANRAGYATVLYPVIALGLSTLFESFHWTLGAGIGIALILAGNILVLARR